MSAIGTRVPDSECTSLVTLALYITRMNFRRITKVCQTALSFNIASTTLLTLLVYVTIVTSIIVVYEVLPKAPSPSNQLGLDLSTAFRDLQVVCVLCI